MMMGLPVMIQRRPRGLTRSTELWGVSIALFLFGVLMPKGERVLLGLGICMGLFAFALCQLNLFASSWFGL